VLQPFRRQVWRKFSLVSVFGLLVGLSTALNGLPTLAAVQGLGRPSSPLEMPEASAPGVRPAPAKPRRTPVPGPVSLRDLQRNLRNGVYLFGDAQLPNQLERSYFIFQIENQQVVGAVYTPGSSFDCFYGTQKPGNLEVQVFDSFENNYYPHAVALSDYYSLAQISGNDQRILQTCRAAAPQQPPMQLRSRQLP
jgi:hypothetical protein